VLKKLLTHNADPTKPSDNLKGFPIFLIANSFLAGRKVPPIDDNIGHMLFDFLDFHARKCDHANVVIAPTGESARVDFDDIEDCAKDDLIVINPCPGISGGTNATKGYVGNLIFSKSWHYLLLVLTLTVVHWFWAGLPDCRL